MALRVLTLPIGFKKSFQRMPRILKAVRKAIPERRPRMIPRGVARCCRRTCRVVGTSTKRVTRYNRPRPINKPGVTFTTGKLNKVFQAGSCFSGDAFGGMETCGSVGSVRPNGSFPYRFITGASSTAVLAGAKNAASTLDGWGYLIKRVGRRNDCA